MMNGELSSIVIVGKYTHESYGYNKVLDCSIPWSDRHQSKPQLLTTGSIPSKLPNAQWDSLHNHMVTKSITGTGRLSYATREFLLPTWFSTKWPPKESKSWKHPAVCLTFWLFVWPFTSRSFVFHDRLPVELWNPKSHISKKILSLQASPSSLEKYHFATYCNLSMYWVVKGL